MIRMLRKWCMILTVWISIIMFFMLLIQHPQAYYDIYSFPKRTLGGFPYFHDYTHGKWRGFTPKQIASLSKLGQIIYLDYNPPIVDTTLKNYKILTWKHKPYLEHQFIKHFTEQLIDPFENCSVKNCHITYKDEDLKTADLVLFHLHRTKTVEDIPKGQRNSQQIWTFLTMESPLKTFRFPSRFKIQNFNGLFNWSMTYRMDSDIPIPYGRTIALKRGEKGIEVQLDAWSKTKRQDVLVAIIMPACFSENHHGRYVMELKRHIPVDTYGRCGSLQCPGRLINCSVEISRYKFYLSFENLNCDEYITEKLWWNAFAKNAIPIVMGGSKSSYRQFLPPNSYLNVEDFKNPRHLANYILYLNKTPSQLEEYFSWKKYFKVVNEHGYYQTNSVHYCRICEALNYNSKEVKVYADVNQFWSKKMCHKYWDYSGIPRKFQILELPEVIKFFRKRDL